MPIFRTGIADTFAQSQAAINNVIADPDLYAALSAYKYNLDRLHYGSGLCDTARTLQQRQKHTYGSLTTAITTLATVQSEAKDMYMRHIKVARVALTGDQGAQRKLELSSRRSKRLTEWIEQGQLFYTNALGDAAILDQLVTFDLTQAVLTDGQRRIEAVSGALAAQLQYKGAARDALSARDQALTALRIWMRDFRKIARVALQDRPMLLEKLGIAAPHRHAARPATPHTDALPATGTLGGDAINAAALAPTPPTPGNRKSETINGHQS